MTTLNCGECLAGHKETMNEKLEIIAELRNELAALKKDARIINLHFREYHRGESTVLDIISDSIAEATKEGE